MVFYRDLVNALAARLGAIPELLAALAPVDPIVAYIDTNPTSNSVETAIYQMQPGTLLVAWTETRLLREEMSKWAHIVEIYVKALPDQSDLDLIGIIMAGVPVPGDGLIWRMCPVLPGLLPTDVTAITRRTDAEGLDYGVIETESAETGDWPNP